jgi:outer membrane protein assembly factor BamB
MKHGLVLAGLLLFCLPQIAGANVAAGNPERGSIALLDGTSGSEIAHMSANGAVVAAVADGGNGWFVGGSFTRLEGLPRVALAHVLPNGVVDPAWHTSVGSASGRPVAVNALARAGSRLFLAGRFGRVGGLQRPGLAAIDARTGAVLRRWSPRPRAWLDVAALVVAGPRLLVARQSTYPTPGITALDARTGAVDRRWNAHLLLIGDAGSFNTMLVHSSRVYAAGSFHVAGLHRNGLVALDARSGRPDRRFAPQVLNCSVCKGFAVLYGLALSKRRLYISGYFGHVGGLPRNGVAALDPRTGAVDVGWRPSRGGRDILRLVLVGSRLYLGGMSGLRALDARTGAVLRLPRIAAPAHVLALAVAGRRLLVAGRG